jgi:hypothetical protein
VDPFFSPPVKDASSLTFTSHPLTHSLTPVPAWRTFTCPKQ